MASVTKDLGIVSAYGYAKAGGYTGTEEEFQAIFNEFTEDAPGLLDRLDEAVDDAEAAEAAAVAANTAAQAAKTAAETAASTFTTDTTLAVSGKAADAKVTGDEITGLKTAITFEDYEVAIDFPKMLGTGTRPYGWTTGAYDGSSGAAITDTHFIRTLTGGYAEIVAPPNTYKLKAVAPTGNYYIAVNEYKADGTFVTRYGLAHNSSGTGTKTVEVTATPDYIYKLTVGRDSTNQSSQWLTESFISQISFSFFVRESKANAEIENDSKPVYANKDNYTILCAKETNYNDGTQPTTDYYLTLSNSGNLYLTKDFRTFKFLLKPFIQPIQYKWAILKNGDIVAVYRVENSDSGSSDANSRKNPYVLKASENWNALHEVDFGNNLKPCGWLENCGFCSMPDGSAMFAEYTRPSVETANCWKITGDASVAANWTVKKSFTLSGSSQTGFKHCHAVNYDFYNDVYYLCTGDDDTGAQVWYSQDNGDTWALAREASEKYCRMLNMIFTPDYIFWASDSSPSANHYLFKCGRTEQGVIDYASVVEVGSLAQTYVASYGISYVKKYDLLVMLEKADNNISNLIIKAYDIANNEMITLVNIASVNTAAPIGFRTEYSEFYPIGTSIKFGFGAAQGLSTYTNLMKMLGNRAASVAWQNNVNNVEMHICKSGTEYTTFFTTVSIV